MFKIFSLTAVLTLCCVFSAQAQKIGHASSTDILASMPETKNINDQLTAIKAKMKQVLDEKTKSLDEATGKLQNEVKTGVIKDQQVYQARMNILEKQAKSIESAAKDNEQKLIAKQQELFAPVKERFDQAVTKVAKAQGVEYILDESVGNFMPGPGSIDLSADIKQELGISATGGK